MALPDVVQTRVSALETRLAKCKRELNLLRKAKKSEEHDKVRDEEFIGIFKDTCSLVRGAELTDAPYLVELAKAADKILDDGVGYSYGRGGHSKFDEGVYDFMPSWAHDDAGDRPLIEGENGGKFPMPHAGLERYIKMAQSWSGVSSKGDYLSAFTLEPWDPSSKRHPKSTYLSRFRPDLPPLTPTLGKPLAASTTHELGRYMPGFDCNGRLEESLASPGISPLNQPIAPSDNFPAKRFVEPGLSDVAYHAAIDEATQCIFVGDDSRVKSYEWGILNQIHEEPLPVHTLDTECYRGPMTILPNGSIARAGKGGVSIWETQTLPTHGPDGNEIIGESVEDFDTMRDDAAEIKPCSVAAT
ncbi:hypothetical protein FRC11_012807 [Ceratobasidium sp. 423]|nr:hypothetical protein FRC11_012807 [Ceratobasidium sp. 423]